MKRTKKITHKFFKQLDPKNKGKRMVLPIKEFCTYCGRQMVEVDPIQLGYDSKTGKKRMRRWAICPRKNNWLVKLAMDDIFHNEHGIGEVYLIPNIKS